MKRAMFGWLSLAILAAAGCGKKEVKYVAMGEASPAFGATSESKTLDKFVVGRWCIHEEMMGNAEVTPSRYYDFKADGTFTAGDTEKEWKTAGKWALQGTVVNLTYETFNGTPTQQFKDDYKKAEEGGTQAAVARALMFDRIFSELDKLTTLAVATNPKLLDFTGSAPVAPQGLPGGESGGGGVEQMMQSMGGTGLERMTVKKE